MAFKIPCSATPLAIVFGAIVAAVCYFMYKQIFEKAGYQGKTLGIKTYLQQDTSGMDFPITNNTGYRNPTVGLPIIPISTSNSIGEILSPARSKSVMPNVQEAIIYRGPMDQSRNLPRPTTGAVMNNELALTSTHNIAGTN